MPQDKDLITVAVAARLARRSTGTVRRWLRDPAVQVTKYTDGSGRVYLDRNQVLAHVTPVPVADGLEP